MSAHRATFRNTVLLVLSILVGLPAVAGATHYPTGSSCYDCHAVSKSKMVLGTHLIKKSQKTSDLGVTGGAPIPCLFCHEDNAVSVTRTNMLGVWGHFDATSQSKHPVDIFSTGSGNPAALDCLDCHTGISAVVVSDGAGNATVHGKDAATQTLDVYTETLIGAPANSAALSASTCQAAACHDVDGGGVGDYNAPARHTIAKTTINDGAAPTSCTQCHGKHNSYQNDSLIVLRTDGTTSNNPTDAPSGAVTPDKCGECHDADDGGAGSPWLADGHGRSDVGGGALTCTSCHDAAVPHSFSASATGTNDLRFALSFDAGQTSTLTSKMTYSVCLTCHSTLTGKAHGPQNVGCIDCHEPHGKGVGANIKMVRTQIPVASPTDTIQFTGSAGVSVAADFTDWGNTRGAGASGTSKGVCDNADCHGTASYTPAATYTTGGAHTGGVLTSGTDCSGCHNHTDTNGGWGAGASCTNCHGFPPTSNAHITHVTDSNLGCLNCHPDPGTVNHNESGVADQAAFDNLMLSNPGTIRNNVDVAFTQAVYTTGSYSAAKGARANDTTTYYDCTTACHGGALPVATQGTDIQPTWDVATSGACGTCHKADDVNTPGTNNHVKHANTAGGRGFTCQTCHAGTYDGTNLLAAHLDGDSATDVVASGTFNSVAVNIAYTAPNCTTISCHGNYSAVAWGATEGNCANCHGTFDGTYDSIGGMVGAVAKHKEADWTNNLGGDNTTYYGVAHKPGAVAVGTNREGYCDYCHANTQATYTAGMHIDGSIQLNSSMAYAGVSGNDGGTAGCASACHVQTTPYLMSDSTLPLTNIVGAGFGCGACHNDGTVPPTSGAHAAHLDSARGAAWTNTGDFSACEACHGLPPDGVPNGWSDNNYEHNNGTLAFADNIPAGEGTVTYSDAGTPGTGAAANDDTCSTSDCHSASPQTATWGTPTSVNCDQCHYGTTGTPTSVANTGVNAIGGSHNAHFDATGRNVVCTDCHASAAGQTAPRAHIDNVSGADDKTKLIDKANATQDEATVTAAALNTGSDADPGNPVCNNTQCHNPSADGHASPAWGTASASCELCHNSATAPATATGSHVKHVTTMGYACTACHPDNGINYGHSSQVVDFPTITYTGNAASYPGTYGSCSAGACHAGSLVWGGTPTICSDCHSGTGDTNNFVGNDSTATVVDDTEWTTYGHGAKAKGCLDCHDMAVAHDSTAGLTGTNPFRLKTGFTCSDNTAGCHAPGTTGPATGLDISSFVTHSATEMTNAGYTPKYTWTFSPECVNCHDPHGDGTNVSMIQKELYDKATFGLPAGSPPAAPTEQTNLTFTDDTTGLGAASYADTTAKSSICQECHEGTTPGTDTTFAFVDNTRANWTGHPGYVAAETDNPGDCSGCHKHDSAFKPSGCNGCHGGGTATGDVANYWPDGADTAGDNTTPDNSGRHQRHMTELAQRVYGETATGVAGGDDILNNNTALNPGVTSDTKQKALCEYCHAATTNDSDHGVTANLPAEVFVDADLVRHAKSLWGAADSDAAFNPYVDGVTVNDDTCANVDCHYNNRTTDNTYGWYDAGTSSCSMCHGQGAGVPWPNVGAHNAHFTAFGIASLTDAAAPAKCDYCHTGYGSGTAFHADGNRQQVAISTPTFQDKSGGALSYSGTTDGTCSNVSCHGGAVTPAWSTGSLAETTEAGCTTCHGVARGEYNDPVSGKHPAHVTTAGKLCTDCHGTTPVATHFSDTQLATTALQNPSSFNAANVTYSDSTTTGPPYYSATGSSGTCTTVACHSGGVNWDPTATGGCNFCHGYPPLTDASANDKHATGATPVNHTITADSGATLLANHDDCTTCHGTKDDGAGGHTDKSPYVTATNHQNGNITMNGPSPATGAGYNATNFGCDNACHNNDVSHRLSDSALTVEYLDLGAGACDACHGPGGSGPTVVWPTGNATGKDNLYGSHLKALTGDALSGTTDWAVQCKKCHPFHSGGSATVPLPPTSWNAMNMQTQLGIDYTTHGGIYLGGTSTTGTTEAEICWNCHSTNSISEWGLNTDTNGAGNNFNFGSLTTPNWTTATWNSANFAYKSGAIESTHSVNFTAGSSAVTGTAYNYTESPDAVANIRCSYCHDVHDLNKAVSDTASLPPHLRGTWMGNPYKEDGAPQSGTAYPNNGNWGAVPRGSNLTTTMGGYWIDGNSGNPTSGWTLGSSAGLCTLCHGTNVNGMDLTTGEGLWVGTNGHSNAVIGGSGSVAANIFDARGGQSGYSNNPYQHFQGMQDPADSGSWGFRSENSKAHRYTPAVNPGNTRPRMYNTDNWGVNETGGTTESLYHKFSCSKCHNPHASRLPKLMISNCLDTKHNTWDNGYQTASVGSNNNGRSISNWTSAQNCHRLGGDDPSDTRDTPGVGNGWNKVSPW